MVVAYGYDVTIEWVTYQLGTMYQVLGTGYEQPEDVKVSADGVHAYVTERAGNLLRVDLSSANRGAATVVVTGMTAPEQLFLDENASVAYTVEYAAERDAVAYRPDERDQNCGGHRSAVCGWDHPQPRPPVRLHQRADDRPRRRAGEPLPAQQRTARGPGHRPDRCRFLTWADSSQTTLYCPERDPANALVTVNTSGGSTVTAMGLASRPSSVAVVSPGFLLICCDQVIEEVLLAASGLQPNGPLQSIGFIPFDWITSAGLGNTTAFDPSYFLPREQRALRGLAPGDGQLPPGRSGRRQLLPGAGRREPSHGPVQHRQMGRHRVRGGHLRPADAGPGNPGYYPVPSISDLMLYVQPLPGCYLDSTNLASGQIHTITAEFFDATGTAIESATRSPSTWTTTRARCHLPKRRSGPARRRPTAATWHTTRSPPPPTT